MSLDITPRSCFPQPNASLIENVQVAPSEPIHANIHLWEALTESGARKSEYLAGEIRNRSYL
jgi:hypothetical protein